MPELPNAGAETGFQNRIIIGHGKRVFVADFKSTDYKYHFVFEIIAQSLSTAQSPNQNRRRQALGL